MTSRRALLLVLLPASLLAAAPLLALDPRLHVSQYGRRTWDRENGLPHSVVNAVVQTRDGYVWAGTEYGLTRLDGTRAVRFTRENVPQLGKGFVFSLAADPDGSLWIGTSGNGLVRYRDGRFESLDGVAAAGALQIFDLDVEPDGTLWMGTSAGAVRRTSDGRVSVFPVPASAPSRFARTILAHEGRVFAGTAAGLAELRGAALHPLPMPPGPARSVHALHRDRAGTIWIGTNAGLRRLDGDIVRPVDANISPGPTHIETIVEDGDGNLWVGAADGLKRISSGRVESFSADDGLSGNVIGALYEDRQATLWVGTYGGLTQLRDTPFTPLARTRSPLDPSVLAVAQDAGGTMWFASASGVGRLRNGAMRWYGKGSGLARGVVLTVAAAPDGVWAGTYGGGICRIRGDDVTCYDRRDGLAGDIAAALLADSRGGLWIGLLEGSLQYRSGETLSTYGVESGLPGHPIVGLAPAGAGGVWVAMVRGGVVRFDRGRVVESLPLAPGNAFVSVRSVLEDDDGTVWIASSDRGLLRWRSGTVTAYGLERFGFTSEAQQVVDDGLGSLWVTSMNGIARIRKAELHAWAEGWRTDVPLQVYGSGSGLPSAEGSPGSPGAIRAADGTLWFGTGMGVASIDPRSRPERHVALPVLIESVTADQTGVEPGGGVSAAARRIAFRFTAPEFIEPGKTRFRYRLEGFDRTWVEAAASRVVEYTNIPAGEYTFHVAVEGSSGPPASFRFRRLPVFHERPLFRLACVALLVLAIFAGVRARIRSLQRREQFLMERVDEQTVQLRQAHEHKQLILNSTSDGILELDERGLITFANAAAARMLGGTADALVGLPIHDWERGGEYRSAVFSTLTGGSIPVEYSATSLPSSRVVITFCDISERLAMEEMKQQLVSTVGHELRTPLTSIRGALGLLRAGKLGTVNEKGQRMVEIAVCHADRLVRLINDMLDLERLDSGRMELIRTVTDASAAISQAVEGIQALADQAHVRIEWSSPPRELLADHDRIIQTLMNLLGNAIKFSPPGSTVRVSGAAEGDEFVFRVADEGRGIPEDKLETIFERFRQVDASDSRVQRGTGLGLAICRSIVSAHGGRIWAARNGECGSVFQFTIPAA